MVNEFEQVLIKKVKAGNTEAFETLITNYEKAVYNIAYRFFNNEEDAKDVAQEVFIKVYKNIKNFEENSSFYTWIYRIAYNTSIDEIRKRKNSTISLDSAIETEDGAMAIEIKDDSKTPEETYISTETSGEILEAVKLLSEEHKSLIILRDLQGMSYTEIAEITQMSMGTVKSRLSRARSNLKNIFIKLQEQKKLRIVK